MIATSPEHTVTGVSGLTSGRRVAVVAALILSIGFEIGSRAINVFSDSEPLERLMSVVSSALVAVTMIALVRITRQGPTVRAFIVAAIVMIFLSQIVGFTAGFESLRGAPLVGGGTASNSFLRSLADYGGLVCLVLGFFFMIFDLDDAYRSLERQRELLAAEVAKQAEQEADLRRSEEQYRNLVEATHVIPWEVDLKTWRFLYVGPHAEKMFGYPIEAWYAENFWTDHIHPDDREEAVRFCLAQTEQGLAHDFEYRMIRADGSAIWIRDIVSVDRREGVPPRLRGVMIDVTEQRSAAQRLAASERRFRFLYDNTPVMMHSIDEAGRIVDVNQYWLDVMGYDREEVLGRPSAAFLAPESRDRATAIHLPEYWRAGRIANVEYRYVRKNGATFEAVLSAVVADDPDAPNKTSLAFIVDVSERKRIEREQRDLQERMQHAQKLESLGVLAGGVAHDFNNLLMAITGNAALALDEAGEEGPAADRLREIERNARRGAELCRQMLAYSGKGILSTEPVRINAIIRDMGDLLHVTHGKKIELAFHLGDGLPPVEADPGQIGQIVMNLILNAAEAIGDAAGAIDVATGAVEMDSAALAGYYGADALRPGRYVTLIVRDDGPGMSPEIAGRVFEPFYTTKFTGRGLGMAVVLGIIRSHGGAIRVDSAPGRGTEVRIILPPCDPAPISHAPAPSVGRAEGGAVIVADDEPSVLDVTRRILERAGYRVITAENGREAVDRFTVHREEVAAVVLDMTMPVMSGAEAASAIRGAAPEMPIVLTSGYSADDIRSRSDHGPGVGYLQKPYRPQELVALLQRLGTAAS